MARARACLVVWSCLVFPVAACDRDSNRDVGLEVVARLQAPPQAETQDGSKPGLLGRTGEPDPGVDGQDLTRVWSEAPASRAIRDASRAVVQVTAVDGTIDDPRIRARGSGTIVRADGTVLTSLHVLYDESRHELHDRFIIAMSQGFGHEAIPVCTGRIDDGAFEERLDLALVRCERDTAGAPLGPRIWPILEPVEAFADERESEVHVLGFAEPDPGQLVWSRGSTSTEKDAPADAGSTLANTDAAVLPGMSGGPVVSADGRLLGVATAYRYRLHPLSDDRTRVSVTRIGRVQLIDPARDWLHTERPKVRPLPYENPSQDVPTKMR